MQNNASIISLLYIILLGEVWTCKLLFNVASRGGDDLTASYTSYTVM